MKCFFSQSIPALCFSISLAMGPVRADSIGLDFGSNTGSGGPTPIMFSHEVAGIAPQANWNSFNQFNQPFPVQLVNNLGILSGASVTWSGVTNSWSLPISTATGDLHMMKGYIENIVNGTITVTFQNIPYSIYDVYVYADGEGFGTRQGLYAYSTSANQFGNQIWTDPPLTEFHGVYLANMNYVKFSSLSGSTLQIDATVLSLRAPINGIQIVGVPAPAGWVLLVLGGIAVIVMQYQMRSGRKMILLSGPAN